LERNLIAKQLRAKQHIDETARLIQQYFSETPVRLSTKPSECGQWNIVFISEITKYDPAISCVVGDALFNLRSSLDHMMMLIVSRHCTPVLQKVEKVYFPIKKDAAEFSKWRKEDYHAKLLPAPILDAIDGLKPYKGGSSHLSILHELNNIDKHRNLVISALNYKSMNALSMFDKESLGKIVEAKHGDMMASMLSNLWINDKNMNKEITVGQELTRYRVDKTAGDPQIKFEFSIFEANVEVKPVIELLVEIDREVTAVHNALEPFF